MEYFFFKKGRLSKRKSPNKKSKLGNWYCLYPACLWFTIKMYVESSLYVVQFNYDFKAGFWVETWLSPSFTHTCLLKKIQNLCLVSEEIPGMAPRTTKKIRDYSFLSMILAVIQRTNSRNKLHLASFQYSQIWLENRKLGTKFLYSDILNRLWSLKISEYGQ